MAGRRQPLAQPSDMDVHRALLDEDVIAPDLVEQLGAAVHALRMGHQEVQHAELDVAQLDVPPVARDAAQAGIEPEARDLGDVIGALGRHAPQQCLDTREQLACRERLRDVVVHPGLERRDLVRLARATGQHDDRDVSGARIAAQPPRKGHPQRVGQYPVEQYQARQSAAHRRFRLDNARSMQDAVAGVLQVDREQMLDFGFVFDDQYRSVHRDFTAYLPEDSKAIILHVTPTRYRSRLIFW